MCVCVCVCVMCIYYIYVFVSFVWFDLDVYVCFLFIVHYIGDHVLFEESLQSVLVCARACVRA